MASGSASVSQYTTTQAKTAARRWGSRPSPGQGQASTVTNGTGPAGERDEPVADLAPLPLGIARLSAPDRLQVDGWAPR